MLKLYLFQKINPPLAGFLLPGENMPASLNSQIGSKEQYNAELVQKFFHAESRHARGYRII
jgi:hypothetical protein